MLTTLFLIVFSCYLIQSHLTLRGETVNSKTHLLRYSLSFIFSNFLASGDVTIIAGRQREGSAAMLT